MKNFTLKQILKKIWSLLENGVPDGKSVFHIATLSTINSMGKPATRSVVIREVNKSKKIISFNTDIRSKKWEELIVNPSSTLHFYDPSLKIQIRISGTSLLYHNNNLSKKAWSQSESMSQVCYVTPLSPGKIIDSPEYTDQFIKEYNQKEQEQGIINFGRINLVVSEIEWIYLVHTGHRRAKFIFGKKDIKMFWIAP